MWLDKHKDERSKLMRWFLKLQDYNYEIVHKPRKENLNADALSRLPTVAYLELMCDKDQELETNTIITMNEELRNDQMREPFYRNLMFYIEEGILPKEESSIKETIILSQFFTMDGGILYHIWTPQEK